MMHGSTVQEICSTFHQEMLINVTTLFAFNGRHIEGHAADLLTGAAMSSHLIPPPAVYGWVKQ